MTEMFYKIRRKTDGLYSKGGQDPTFGKTGKVWKRRGDLTLHLAQVRKQSVYATSEVVELEMIETQAYDVSNALVEINERKAEREAERQARIDAYHRDQRRKQYEQLKREFGEAQ